MGAVTKAADATMRYIWFYQTNMAGEMVVVYISWTIDLMCGI